VPARRAAAADKGPFAYGADLANRIESRWQAHWEASGTFDSPNPSGPLSEGFQRVAGRPKFYVLDMFPYPSGAGLHVGHPLGYIGTDVLARYLRMTGRHVLHPFGYDAFGLPAEQYAIDTGQHPSVTTAANIATMRRQLRRLGLGHDRRRELATTDVAFYRWTQWIFLQLFNSWYDQRAGRARPIAELEAELAAGAGPPGSSATPWARLDGLARRRLVDGHRLAYLSEVLVNWCPGLGTVLANEEVTAEGRSDIGNYPVFRRPLRQWVLRITAYAERLLADLDLVDWPESIKRQQRDWIGRSDGARIDLPMAEAPATRVAVFTTRPDTLPGATFVVLAPEHPQVDQLVARRWPASTPAAWRGPGAAGGSTPRDAVDAYRRRAASRSDRQRLAAAAGGVFTGSYATNPATGEPMPVFVADYVLTGYGTGAVMGVPAHDQRDLEFARAFGLPVRAVLGPPPEWLEQRGLPAGAPAEDWPEAFVGEHGYLDLPGSSLRLAGADLPAAVERTIGWLEARRLGERARSYRMRDWLFSRQRYWGEPFPIVYDEHGLPVALPEDMLPVELPAMTDFRPEVGDEASVPVPPLARAGSWVEVELDLGDGRRRYRRETNTMPQWAGSCWYYLRFLDPGNDTAMVDPEVERYWMRSADAEEGRGGVDLYVGGVEHAVLHLLYARFWHKVLFDLGHVSTREPFMRLYNQGYILADAFLDSRGMYLPAAEVTRLPDGSYAHGDRPVTRRSGKMGKSLKNGISPDEIYAAYGADTLRLYEMAMGPLDADRPWRTDDIVGVHRFLQRLWRNLIDEWTGEPLVDDGPLDQATTRHLHRTVAVVRRDFAGLRFNTAIARLIELNHDLTRLVAARGRAPRGLVEPLVLMVAPLAPHIAEELWARLGHQASLAYEPFPEPDPVLAGDDTLRLPVQVNGKVRFHVEVDAAAGEDEVTAAVMAHQALAGHLAGRTVQRVIVVPGRIVNLLVA
jgi:leucyl-tRNA synthetase